jgi:hypothetical protein
MDCPKETKNNDPIYNMYMNRRKSFIDIFDKEKKEKGIGALIIEVRGSNVMVSYIPIETLDKKIYNAINSYIQYSIESSKVVVLKAGDDLRIIEEYDQILNNDHLNLASNPDLDLNNMNNTNQSESLAKLSNSHNDLSTI